MAVWLMPGVMAMLFAMMLTLPWLSPRNFSVDTFRDTFNYVMVVTITLMGYLHVIMLQAGLHPQTDMGKFLLAGIFLFLALIGNVMGKVRRNFWMGVRTPWTLASDTVWNATHRLAARLLFAGGIIGAVAVSLGVPAAVCFVLLILVLLIPVPYSLVLYKKLEGTG